jgi:hypothetical protein
MSKKKLLEFGLKEADAFQKNFKIIFDRLVRGYKSIMGREPEGLDLLKVKMEAREKALNTTKVVNQKGLTLDPDKPITGGTQEGIPTIKTKFDEELDEFNLSKDDPMGDLEKIVKGEGDTGLPKGQRPFGDNIRDAYREAGRSREDASEMIEALQSPGAKKSSEIMEEVLGVRLYGDETFEELMQIKKTGVHPRGEPPIKKADGGRVGFALGGPSNIIGSDLSQPGAGLLGVMGVEEDDEFADIQGQTAGLGVLSGLKSVFGGKLGEYIFQRGKTKAFKMAQDKISQEIQRRKQAQEAAEQLVKALAVQNRMENRGGYQSSFGGDSDFMGGSGTAAEMGSFADGGLATMFVEKR